MTDLISNDLAERGKVFSSAPSNFDGVDKMFGSDCDIIKSLCYCECCSSGV